MKKNIFFSLNLFLITTLMASLVLSGCIANFFSSGKVAKQSKAGAGVLRLENLPYPLRPGEVLEGDYVPPTTPTDTTVSSGPTEATLSSEPFGPPPASETEVAVLETKFGKIIIELNDRMAPIHSENFRKNCRTGFYTETTFHRVVPGFLIQGGDINSKDDDRNNDGFGYPGYTLPLEKKLKHVRGAVGAGRKMDKVNPERRSDGTQFYICLADAPFLDGKYTVFGRVVAGMNVVDRITQVPRDERDNPIHRIEMRATLMKYREAMANP